MSCYHWVNTKPQVPSNVLSISQLKSMSLTDQVLALLKNGECSVNGFLSLSQHQTTGA